MCYDNFTGPGHLMINDFKLVYKMLYPARSKWENIAIELDITKDSIDAIKKDNPDVDACQREVISKYLRTKSPSWQTIAAALKAESVGYDEIASNVERTYLMSSADKLMISDKVDHETLTPITVVQKQTLTSDLVFNVCVGSAHWIHT